MAKARDAIVTELEGPRWSVEWLTQVAFVLALALVVARVTFPDASRAREALASTAPRGAGPATSIALDLLCCVPAILVLARFGMNPLALYAVLQKMIALGTESASLAQLQKTHPPLDSRMDRIDRRGYGALEPYTARD